MQNVFISVVVTAYNRKDFLLEALTSVVNQTLSRDKYEIICVKNYKEKQIDDYIERNGIKSVLALDLPVGQYIYRA